MGRFSAADELIARTAERYHGVFNLQQAHAAGHSDGSIRVRMDTGRWKPVLPRVYRHAGTTLGWRGRCSAACLWVGEQVALSGPSAARLYGLDGFPGSPIEISTTIKRSSRRGLVVRRVDSYLLDEFVVVDNIPTTTAPRLIRELCGRKHPRRERAMDQCLREGKTSLDELWMQYEKDWTRGRRGVAIERALLMERSPGLAPTDSDLEDMFMEIVRDYALPNPDPQCPAQLPSGLIHFDFGYPSIKLGIELDSYAWHQDREAFERDRQRDLEASLCGWTVLRFTWAMLKYQPDYVAQVVRRHLTVPIAR